jgi:hypothetical protein
MFTVWLAMRAIKRTIFPVRSSFFYFCKKRHAEIAAAGGCGAGCAAHITLSCNLHAI